MPKQYPPATRDRAIKMVLAHRDEYESVYKAALSIGPKVGVKPESLRRWVQGQLEEGTPKAQAALDAREEALVVKKLKRKVQELEDANRILLEASIFFAGELDPRRSRL